ncbi:hypothetical protein Tco_1129134, partial [Tanacetum coccineum]
LPSPKRIGKTCDVLSLAKLGAVQGNAAFDMSTIYAMQLAIVNYCMYKHRLPIEQKYLILPISQSRDLSLEIVGRGDVILSLHVFQFCLEEHWKNFICRHGSHN